MRNLIKILILIFAAMLQRTVCPYIGIIDIVPDIVTALAAAYALSSKSLREAGVYGFAAGALEDIMWGRIFGERALLFMYIALIVFYTSEYMYKKTLTVAAFFTFAAYALCESHVRFGFYNKRRRRISAHSFQSYNSCGGIHFAF